MKKATQKTIFKLLSLVLTLAMVFAVATIPTLTASADEVAYVTDRIYDFEEGVLPSEWNSSTSSHWTVAAAPTADVVCDSYSLYHKYSTGNTTLSLNNFV